MCADHRLCRLIRVLPAVLIRLPPFACLALFLLVIPAYAQVSFVLPWNDSTSAGTDFSSLNAPLGTNRVAVDANGHFAVDGRRLRFLGVNFAGDSPFMPTNKAEGAAARLAKFGVNSVRFHHMDAPWAAGGGLLSYGASSTNINASQLERLHYMVWRLKEHGIYSDINLLVGREYRAGDGLGPEVVPMDMKDQHILGFFYEPALALQKDYARKLLTPTNRFSGLPLAKDPAVAFIEIINENGMVQKWLDGGLDRLPARYATNLQARWNYWLAARYPTDAAMLAAWGVLDQPLGANLVRNGPFTNGFTYWNFEQHTTARAGLTRTLEFTGNQPSARITVTNPTDTSWHIQLNQGNVPLVSNRTYTVSFWAKSSPATNADFAVSRAHTDYALLGYARNLALTTQWQFFTGTFQAPVTEINARVNFSGMGNKAATFWYADVRFQPGGQLGQLPNGASLAARTVPALKYSGEGYTGTREARRDWMRFLRDLENAYYDTMVAYIRTDLGYPGLIFGTIMANSPASVQSRLDVIDGHAYWQHPQFPGNPWDSVNWVVPNVSMVNTLDNDNTLAGLARQRIRGKPFTITEYQHSSPNYYGAEGPLLLAAYAGLQDWDGLWLFDYGPGNDATATMGYVRGFFEIGQHPTKMANLLLAANLFRRGDIRPARHEITMALNPERELELLLNASAWGVFSGGQLGLSGRLAFTNRIATSFEGGLLSAPTAPTANNLVSDTGELRWNASQTGRGVVTVNSSRTKAVLGFCDNTTFDFGALRVRPGTTELGWCTWGATLTRGEVFTNDCTFLVVASGWWENTGQVWKDSQKNSVGNQWGRAPVQVEVVPFTLMLPVGTNYVQAWALNERGQRKTALPVTGSSSSATITITNNAATLWYEVQIGRWMANFDLWRARYFSAEELADSGISSATATPDGDRVPNLLKYYLGLPGRAPAGAEQLPCGALLQVNGKPHAGLVYTRDKLAGDVICEAEVSADLQVWSHDCCITEDVLALGELEQVTLCDLTPLEGVLQRFLRLYLTRR